jgi:hypothetical protein
MRQTVNVSTYLATPLNGSGERQLQRKEHQMQNGARERDVGRTRYARRLRSPSLGPPATCKGPSPILGLGSLK